MRILFITPAENEFKREKEGFFDALGKLISEIKKGHEDFDAEILDISGFNIDRTTVGDVRTKLESLGHPVSGFDAIHTFSVLPFIYGVYFQNFIIYSLKSAFLDEIPEGIKVLNGICLDFDKFEPEPFYSFYFYHINNQKIYEKRPWGWWKTLIISDGYKIKQFYVAPGQKLSLQTHEYRSEIWVIASGSGEITIGDSVVTAKKGDIFTIERKTMHRASGGEKGMTIAEIQLGDYLGEDDIKRIEDIYGRN